MGLYEVCIFEYQSVPGGSYTRFPFKLLLKLQCGFCTTKFLVHIQMGSVGSNLPVLLWPPKSTIFDDLGINMVICLGCAILLESPNCINKCLHLVLHETNWYPPLISDKGALDSVSAYTQQLWECCCSNQLCQHFINLKLQVSCI